MLARAIESQGISTIVVTMMPFWAERVGTPRALGVEFPFGHTLGMPGDVGQQLRVIRRAVRVLSEATEPGTIDHFDEAWNGDEREWRKRWQPAEPSPVIAMLRERAQRQARERREQE